MREHKRGVGEKRVLFWLRAGTPLQSRPTSGEYERPRHLADIHEDDGTNSVQNSVRGHAITFGSGSEMGSEIGSEIGSEPGTPRSRQNLVRSRHFPGLRLGEGGNIS